jgi:sorbitol-specific phosphotransferase system component IIC
LTTFYDKKAKSIFFITNQKETASSAYNHFKSYLKKKEKPPFSASAVVSLKASRSLFLFARKPKIF